MFGNKEAQQGGSKGPPQGSTHGKSLETGIGKLVDSLRVLHCK